MTLSYIYAKIMKKLRGSCVINSEIDKTSTIYSGSELVNCKVGKYTYIGYDCKLEKTIVGGFCSFSDHIFVGGAEHPYDWVSTSPMFEDVKNSGKSIRFARFEVPEHKTTYIGNDVWIGHGVTIKAGVSIGNGVIIGSNAMVTKDIPPYAIVGGVPAKVIKFRFDEKFIAELEDSKWWSLPDEKLSILGKYIKSPKEFLEEIKKI